MYTQWQKFIQNFSGVHAGSWKWTEFLREMKNNVKMFVTKIV